MTLFGLDRDQARRLVEAVMPQEDAGANEDAGAEVDDSWVADAFARGAWSTIAEPGDADAGALIESLGAAGALSQLIADAREEAVLDAVREVSPEAAERSRGGLAEALARWRPRVTSPAAVRAFEDAARLHGRLLTPSHLLWPSALDDLGLHRPQALWMRGSLAACAQLASAVSLVGARACTGYGEHVAAEAAAGLVDRGFAIVSGAAYGIDGMAHRAALASKGTTVAFLAGGVDRFYPSGHDSLLRRIAEEGVVFSEMPCGAAPTRWRFLQRNRLIAAASAATIVLEAGWRSGSLNTAGHAAALGRPLGAVPGPITSPASAGCHRLIREYDAVCVTSPAEMAELAGGADALPGLAPSRARAGRTADETRVLDAMSKRAAREATDISRRCGMSLGQVSAVLGMLQLDGVVRERPGGWVRLS
ncbi:DNA-processing protein DprA [Microbacterium sp. STN6]|uniref:DNA-processing protein DprA n=1 Tax=Microbacterium sp. STN6 TaxID=2995588 RepID=UPI00226103EC|nr:DNA-processing protein DprA [Microbacterium sp. STN6]MCX7522128.1 DNA-processing protein DprA [Microbacterium sp. STN6]